MSRTSLLLVITLLLSSLANAKDKKNKPILTTDVLHAQTALVMISPDAGEKLDDPAGNRRAQEDVVDVAVGRVVVREERDADFVQAVQSLICRHPR